jgi:cellulose synthase/poly-beta-1,6-N-acetylglucosamine synthase-like glycosyltransferase
MPALVIAYFAGVAALALFGLHRLFLLLLYARVRQRAPRALPASGPLPRVTVQLPIYNERYVAQRLLLAAARMDYPHDRLQIQVLDDSDDRTAQRLATLVRRLRACGVAVEYVRRGTRDGFKAGALAHGLLTASGELIVIFDADFVPPHDFLRRTAPWFSDPQVGMVQARWEHLNREWSLLTALQSVFLDGHFLIEHVARSRSGRFFNFNGTAGVWRRECIEAAGGWQGDTLTEDLDLSYRAQLLGWRFVYLNDLTAAAELPIEMNAFKAQQHRWAKGGIQTARKLLPRIWRSRLPWRVKVEATFHLTSNVSYLLMTVPCLLWVPTLVTRYDTHHPWLLAIAATFGLTSVMVVVYHVVSQLVLGRSLRRTLLLSPALLALGLGLSLNNSRAVLEALAGHRSPFRRTPKSGVRRRGDAPGRAYSVRLDGLAWLELVAAAYFAAGVWIAVAQERFIAIPFLLIFLAGFAYVGLSSLGRQIDRVLAVGSLLAVLTLLGLGVWVLQGALGHVAWGG